MASDRGMCSMLVSGFNVRKCVYGSWVGPRLVSFLVSFF